MYRGEAWVGLGLGSTSHGLGREHGLSLGCAWGVSGVLPLPCGGH